MTMPFGYMLKPIQKRDLKVTLEMALYVATIDKVRRTTERALNETQKTAKIGSWEWNTCFASSIELAILFFPYRSAVSLTSIAPAPALVPLIYRDDVRKIRSGNAPPALAPETS